MCVNHFIPYLATRHRIFTKVNKLLWLTRYSIVGGNAPCGVSEQPYTIFILFLFLFLFFLLPLLRSRRASAKSSMVVISKCIRYHG